MSKQRRERKAQRQGDGPSMRSPLLRGMEVMLWVVVAGLFLWRVAPQARAAVGWGSSGGPAPAVTLDLLNGSAVRLADLRGQVVLVNFWATWCPPCRAEMPGFQKAYEAMHKDGFTVVGISMDDASRAHVESFLQDHGIRYPVAMATTDAVAAFGGVDSYPTSFLIDRQGRVRYTVRGFFAEPALRAAVHRLLAEGD
jgi:cytochrome c biogenesis protein CcmG/thiol:disulfide interchange protein DsbE